MFETRLKLSLWNSYYPSAAPIQQVTTFTDYIDGARIFLEGENDKEIGPIVREIKIHFSSFIRNLINGFSREFVGG